MSIVSGEFDIYFNDDECPVKLDFFMNELVGKGDYMLTKLRILVTDYCNYNCIYCHNEGQIYKNSTFLTKDNFFQFFKRLDLEQIERITFSGGEPFTNHDTIEMIKYVYENSRIKISCATLNERIIKTLAYCKVILTINFPSSKAKCYKKITHSQYYETVTSNLTLLKKYDVFFVLNFVLSPYTVGYFDDVLSYCILNNYNMKILPFTNDNGEDVINNILPSVYEKLHSITNDVIIEKDRQRSTFYISNSKETIRIRIYVNPCYKRDICACKSVGELRVLPNLTYKTCLLNDK